MQIDASGCSAVNIQRNCSVIGEVAVGEINTVGVATLRLGNQIKCAVVVNIGSTLRNLGIGLADIQSISKRAFGICRSFKGNVLVVDKSRTLNRTCFGARRGVS